MGLRYGYIYRGYTLIEVLVVLVIAIFVISISIPVFKDKKVSLDSEARKIASYIRYVRSKSINDGEEKELYLDINNKQYFYANDNKRHEIDKKIDLEVISEEKNIKKGIVKIRFFPDGSNDGVIVRLLNKKKVTQVNVSFLTGKVDIIGG